MFDSRVILRVAKWATRQWPIHANCFRRSSRQRAREEAMPNKKFDALLSLKRFDADIHTSDLAGDGLDNS